MAGGELTVLLLLSITPCSSKWAVWQADDTAAAVTRPRSLPSGPIFLHHQLRDYELNPVGRRPLSSLSDAARSSATLSTKEGRGGRKNAQELQNLPVGINETWGTHRRQFVSAAGSVKPGREELLKGRQRRREKSRQPERKENGANEGGTKLADSRQRREGTGIFVRGEGLEEAVMGEQAKVIVEVQGWSQSQDGKGGCGRVVTLQLMRSEHTVEFLSKPSDTECRMLQGQPVSAGKSSFPPLAPPPTPSSPQLPPSLSPPGIPPLTTPPPTDDDPDTPLPPSHDSDSHQGQGVRRGEGSERGRRARVRRLLQAAAQAAADDLVAEDEESERADVDDAGGSVPNDKLQAPSGGGGAPLDSSSGVCSIPDENGACEIYTLHYVAKHWGSFELVVLVDGQESPESPFQPVVFPPPSYPWWNSSTLQAPTDDWQSGDTLYLSVIAKNFLGQRVPSCGAPVSGWLEKSGYERAGHQARAARNNTKIDAVVKCDNSSGTAVYVLSVDETLSDGQWQMSALMDERAVLHSPLMLTVRPGVSPARSRLSGDGTEEAHVGQAAEVVLRLMMQNNKAAVDCREPAILVLVLLEAGSASSTQEAAETENAEQPAGVLSNASLPDGAPLRTVFTGELVSCSAGEYHFTYMLAQSGNYSLSVMVGKDKALVGGKAVMIEALPGALSSQHCGVMGKRLGSGTLLYGASSRRKALLYGGSSFSLYLRDAFNNYISCSHYKRGLDRHNISRVSIYHEPGDDAPAAWAALGRVGRCHDSIYHEESGDHIDGVLDISFVVPHRNLSGESTKEMSLDLEVSVNGRRLKEGPYTTLMRPARLDPAKSLLMGAGMHGAQPGEEQVLLLQLMNELSENMTTCSSSAAQEVVGAAAKTSVKCVALSADMCKQRADCEWIPVDGAVGAGVCNTEQQRELVEIYLEPIVSVEETPRGSEKKVAYLLDWAATDASSKLRDSDLAAPEESATDSQAAAASGSQEKRAGKVKSCDHGTYTLSYSLSEPGRYLLYVKVAGQPLNGGPSRVTVAPGCRSGAVTFPCLGRGLCLRSGACVCTDGYLGAQCEVACPGLTEEGSYCSGRGNCSVLLGSAERLEEMSAAASQQALDGHTAYGGVGHLLPADAAKTNEPPWGVCKCEYGYFGRLCDRECPGGASSACSGSGRCLDNGDCECWSGYGGDKCQFKNKEVQNFGNLAALTIVISMLLVTLVMVAVILLKKAMTRRMEQRYYRTMHNTDEEEREARADTPAAALSPLSGDRKGDDSMSHPMLDDLADQLLQCLPCLVRWLPLPVAATADMLSSIQMASVPARSQAPRKNCNS